MSGDMELPPYRTRLWILFARDVPKAVILRRGPKKHFHLINWDLRDNSFVHGQWMKGYVALCDLSPRGDKLIYWAHQYHAGAEHWNRRSLAIMANSDISAWDPLTSAGGAASNKRYKRRKLSRYMRPAYDGNRRRRAPQRKNEGVWTAISTPPYFSALAIWPSYGHWTGGGMFMSDTVIVLNEDDDGIMPQLNVPMPSKYRILTRDHGSICNPDGSAYTVRPLAADVFARFIKALTDEGVRWIEWAAQRENGDLLFACDGCIYCLEQWTRRQSRDYLASARLLIDLTGLEFQMVRAPSYAMRW